jgi:molybdenum ABC transporter molybdate-binding protein
MRSPPRPSLALAAVAIAFVFACRREPSLTLRVAIAPETSSAFATVGMEFSRADSVGITLYPGDTEIQTRQMLENSTGPYDVYVSFDAGAVGHLVSTGRCEDLSRTFVGFATLVVITSRRVPRLEELRHIVDPHYQHIAVLSAERSPFHRATFQVFASLGLHERLMPRLVQVPTAQRAIELVRNGDVEAAFVPRMSITEGDSLAVPTDLHRSIEQVGVVCVRDPARREAAVRFLQYAHAGDGRALLEAYGFLFP